MDINKINFPATVIADLYRNSLVGNTENTNAIPESKIPAATLQSPGSWKWLGENKKNILVLVSYDNAVHIPDKELQLLTAMLEACKLGLGDVAIVNRNNYPHQDYKAFLDEFKSRVTLLFGIEPATFGLPMNFPFFQIQAFAACSFLYSPSLDELEKDKVLKSKLWVSLRRLFNI